MSGCTAAARCCMLRLDFEVSSASSPLTLASWRAFSSRRMISAFCIRHTAHINSMSPLYYSLSLLHPSKLRTASYSFRVCLC